MNRHKQTLAQVGLPMPSPSRLHTHLRSHTCSLAYLHVRVSVPHVILRIRFHNSYSKNGSILLENLDALAHTQAHAEAYLTSYGSLGKTKIEVVQKVKRCFLPFSIPYQADKIANGKVIPPNLDSQERYKIEYFDISLVLKTIDSHIGTCYALLPFKGRCILKFLKTILLRSMKMQTEFPCMCIHTDSKIKYQHTLFENRSPVYPFRDIDPILYPSILLSHLRVMITNIEKDIKNKGFNDLIDEATHILASLGLNKQIVEVAVGKIIDDVIEDEDKQESLFDALYMHDCVESALVRFETFGSKFSGDIAKAISKSFNSETLSEGQIRAINGV